MLKGEGVEEAGPCGWWCWAFVAGAGGPSSPFMASGVGPSLPFGSGGVLGLCRCGALVCCSWCWALIVFCGWRGWVLVALFVDGGSGPCCAVCGWWWWCALVSFCVPWCMVLITCHSRVVVRVCGCSICRHPMLASCRHPASFPCAVIVCPRHVVVPCPPRCCPMSLLLPCPHCNVLLQ